MTRKVFGGWYQYCLVYISSLFFDKLFFDNFWIAKCYSRRNQKHTRATSGYIRLKICLLSTSINGLWNYRLWTILYRSKSCHVTIFVCHMSHTKIQISLLNQPKHKSFLLTLKNEMLSLLPKPCIGFTVAYWWQRDGRYWWRFWPKLSYLVKFLCHQRFVTIIEVANSCHLNFDPFFNCLEFNFIGYHGDTKNFISNDPIKLRHKLRKWHFQTFRKFLTSKKIPRP